MPQKAEIPELPGFFWEYEPGHGYVGRHAYNPLTGEAYSQKQVRHVRAGEKTLADIRETTYGITSTAEESYIYHIFSVTGFNRLDAAIDWSTRLPNPSYIAVLGKPHTKYPLDEILDRAGKPVYDKVYQQGPRKGQIRKGSGNEPSEFAWRSITGLQDGDKHARDREKTAAKLFELFDMSKQWGSQTRFFVYELIEK